MFADFNCSLLAAGMNNARLVDGYTINTINESVICVKCETTLFLGFRFSAPGAIAEEWSLDHETAKCFKVLGETNLTASAFNEETENDDIQITFYIKMKPYKSK